MGVKLSPPPEITGIFWLEILWMGLPLLIMLVVFVWSATIFVHDSRPAAEQQHEVSNLGMWVFLATEVIFFGRLFTGYTAYRNLYPAGWAVGSHHTEVLLGSINAIVLLTSSFTMALAVRSAQLGKRKLLVSFLLLTILLGSAFLGIKFLEYYHKYLGHLIPAHGFHATGPQPPAG